MDATELVDRFRPLLDGALVATDFDGTMSQLTLDPEDSRPVAGAIDALAALTRHGARVAVITGRDARTVVRLAGLHDLPGLTVAGLYGVETWTAGELTSPDTPAVIEQLRDRLPATLGDADPKVWIEDKRLSLVVHARRAGDPDAALAAIEAAVRTLADDLGLEVHPGSQVLEVRLPGFDKAGALGRLAPGATAVLYLGDDLGDLPAFAETARMRATGVVPAYSVGVLSSGAEGVREAVDVTVADPEAAVSLLADLADLTDLADLADGR